MEIKQNRKLWAVVLAAGQGSRMASVTRLLTGRQLPKQFVALVSERTLLQETIDRIAPQIPSERTVVVVSEAFEDLARAQLAAYPGIQVITQPSDRGTGAGILLPLVHVLAQDPDADVAIFPSDHHVRRADTFIEAVGEAVSLTHQTGVAMTLLGATPDHPATDLGWIVPGTPLVRTAHAVKRFVEKPHDALANLLWGSGALWNTFVIAGRGGAILDQCQKLIPEMTRSFGRYARYAGSRYAVRARGALYEHLQAKDFSRDVLQQANGLGVVNLHQSGWFDCGTPERLVEWLRKTNEREPMLARLSPLWAPAAVSSMAGTALA